MLTHDPGADPTSVPNPIESAARTDPERILLECEGTHLSAQELRDRVARRAQALARAGVTAGSRVGLAGPAGVEWAVSWHALGWLGAEAAPLAARATEGELRRALAVLRPERLLVLSGADRAAAAAAGAAEVPLLEDLREEPAGPGAPERFWPLLEARAVVTTSGTSGTPRAVRLTTAQLLFSAFGSALRLGHSPEDRWLACLPLHHVGGLSPLVRCAFYGTRVALHPTFEPARVAAALDAGEVDLVSLVPTQLERVLAARPARPFPPRLRAILLGGEACSPGLLAACRELGAPVSLTWGMSETASQVATRPPGALEPAERGLPPLPFARIEALDGVLRVRGPVAGGELTTGDRGAVDPRGRVVLAGRADDLIVSGGEKVAPLEVEDLLCQHPAVVEAAVVGVPDPRWGQRPVAYLVGRPAAPRPSAEDLRAWCRGRLSSYKVPERYVWCDLLPRDALGKLSRRKLAAQAVGAAAPARESAETAVAVAEPPPRASAAPADASPLVEVSGADGAAGPALGPLACAVRRVGLSALSGRLLDLDAWLRGALAGVEQDLEALGDADPARDRAQRAASHLLAAPGKRLRPVCVLLAARLGGRSAAAEARDAAVACELVHAATLLHDDVIDGGVERRGRAAARVVYGNSASVLGGDWLLVEALRRVEATGAPALLGSLLEVIREMVEAEALQLERRGRFVADRGLYQRIVDGKTASLFRWALAAGGTLGGLDGRGAGALERAGVALGRAFQLVDDLLDLEGDPTETGKAILADLGEGKATLPLLLAAEREPGLAADLQTLVEAGERDGLAAAQAARFVEEVRRSGALTAAREEAARHGEVARRALGELPPGPARQALELLVDAAVTRSR